MRGKKLLYGFLIAVSLVSCSHKEVPDFYQEVKSVDKLVFASMAINKVAKLEDSEWYTPGKRIAVYSYNTYLRGYIDLSELQPGDIVTDEKSRTVKVRLPAVKTEIAGRDMEMKKEYENIGLLRSNLSAKERAALKERANESLRKEVAENPEFRRQLSEATRKKAREYFATFFESRGYTPEIEFNQQSTEK